MKRLYTPEWVAPQPVDVPDQLRQEIGGSDLFLQMLVRRGYVDPQKARAFLDPSYYQPCPASQLPGLDSALPRIVQAIKNHERIGIWGDFDVDGQTSTAVLLSGFRQLGCDTVYHVPVRGPESHGISIPYLENFLRTGVSLLITCDTGISANNAIEYAQSHGVDVIVTDHHTLPQTLPNALALIDPQFLDEDHPLRTLSGVGVAYKLIEAVYAEMGKTGDEVTLLDLVALGLIADVAILTGDARYLAQRGLLQIRNCPRTSLAAILSENQVQPETVNETVISYVIAPRLNAVGRLGDANPIVEFLLTEDPILIAATCNQIEGLNSDRKIKSDEVFKSAQVMIESEPRLLDKPLLFLGHPEWPTGVVGIVASRLVNLYHRPVILFNTGDPQIAKGSARSVDGIDITCAIASHKNLLVSYGGHPMAAGLAVSTENFDSLKYELIQTIDQIATISDYHPTIEIDAQVNLSEINFQLIDELQRFAPFGPGNPPILFSATNLEIESISSMGRSKEHETILLSDSYGNTFKVVWWQASEMPHPSSRFDMAFSAAISTYKGKTQLQIEWQDYRDCEVEMTSKRSKGQTGINHLDLRASTSPVSELRRIISENETLIFAEGSFSCPLQTVNRENANPSRNLVMWTVPPSLGILQSFINKVKPQNIHWFALSADEENLGILLKRLGSALKSGPGELIYEDAATRFATTSALIHQAFLWFAARGDITLQSDERTHGIYTLVSHPANIQQTELLQNQIQILHNEVCAFRDYYRKTPSPASLLAEEAKRPRKSRA